MGFAGWLNDAGTAGWVADFALQALAASAAGHALLRVARRATAPVRGAIALSVLGILLLMPLARVLLPDRPALFEYSAPSSGEDRSGLEAIDTSARPGLFTASAATADAHGTSTVEGAGGRSRLRLRFSWAAAPLIACLNAFGLVWACGLFISLIRMGWGFVLLRGLRKGAIEAPSEIVDALWQDIGAMFPGKGKPSVFVSPAVPSPVVLGVFRPAVILPLSMSGRWTDAGLRGAFIHEVCHLFHHDHLLGLVQRLVTSIHWWNPVVHGLSRSFSEAREHMCDTSAILGVGARPFAFGLLAVAKQMKGAAVYPTAVGVISSRRPLEVRLRDIIDPSRDMSTHLRRSVAAAISTAAVLVLAVLGGFAWASIIETARVTSIPFPGALEPLSIGTDGRIVVVEATDRGSDSRRKKVSILSPENLSLTRWFEPRATDGPARDLAESWHLSLTASDLWFHLHDGIIILSREGTFRREIRLPADEFRLLGYPVLPVGENYVTFAIAGEDVKAGLLRYTGLILDRDLRRIDSFLENIPFLGPPPPPPPPAGTDDPVKPLFTQVLRPDDDYILIPDCIDFEIVGDRIFVADSRKGFHISVFDSIGHPLYEIDKPFDKVRVPPGFYDKARLTLAARAASGRETPALEQREYFPAFRSFTIADGTIHIVTYAERQGFQEVVRLDLSGRVLGRSFAFPFSGPPDVFYLSSLLLDRRYCIRGNLIFCLAWDTDTDACIRVVEIPQRP